MRGPGQEPGGSRKVLLVEEFAALRRIVKGLLAELEGLEVLEAVDDPGALRILGAGKIDLVISRRECPRAWPPESGKAPASGERRRRIPLLLLASEGRQKETPPAGLRGDAHVLARPFSAAALGNKIRQILETESGTGRSGGPGQRNGGRPLRGPG